MLTGIRAVFFDAVGTLLFPHPTAVEVYAAVARGHGYDISTELIRTRFRAAFRAEEDRDRAADWTTDETREVERWQRIVAATLGEIPDPTACFDELYSHFSRANAWALGDGAGRLLGELHTRGYILGVGSNFDLRLKSVVAETPELAPLKNCIVISSVVGYRKPRREFFREVIRVAGCEAGEILFVGDDIENDCVGATSAGMKTVLIQPHAMRNCEYPAIASLGELLPSAE